MAKREELDLFLLRADELIDSKYILASKKIENLLKSIANSETLLAIFKNCLKDFDYEQECERCFIQSDYLGENKGEFIQPQSSKHLLALVFSILMDIDAGKIDLTEFINRYFYANGSFYESYDSFAKNMIVPFKSTIKTLMLAVLNGAVADPVEELNKKESGEVVDQNEPVYEKIRKAVNEEKEKISSKKESDAKNDGLLIIDTFLSAILTKDKEAIKYAFTAYKYTLKSIAPLKNNVSLVEKLINELSFFKN